MQCKTGSYVGTGIPHAINWTTGPFFTPDLVIVKADDTQYAVFRTSAMPAFYTAQFAGSASIFSNAIRVFISNGFQIGTHTTVNTVGVTYHWVAFYDNGAGDFDVGSYIGNGVDDRNLNVVGFQPTVLWIRPRDAKGEVLSGVWRVAELAGDNTLTFGGSDPVANFIKALLPLGFRLGDSIYVNEDGDEYYYVAFRDAAGLVETGTYVGNGIDDRDINVGFEPDLVFVKGGYYDNHSYLRIDTMPVGQSGAFRSDALLPDRIQGFAANVFQVGTNSNVNLAGYDYYWAAWQVGSSYASTTTTSTTSTTSTSTLSTTSTTSTSTLSTTLTTTTLPFTPVPGTSAVLRICDSEGCVNLLKRGKQSGYRLCGWTPRIADYKRGGIWQDSPIAEGRRLAQRRFGNVTETMTLAMSSHNLETLIREGQDLRRLMEKASNYWWTNWQNDPIWIEARAKCETNIRYAILHRGKILVDNSPYEQPFMERLYGRTAARNLNLVLERGHWMSLPPERSASVLALARGCYEWPWHLEFDGDVSALDCGSDAGLDNLPAGAFTAEAWIRADGWGEGNSGCVFSKTTAKWFLRLHQGLGALYARVYTTGVDGAATVNLSPDGQWHHIAMTFNFATFNYPRLWIDGVEPGYTSSTNKTGAYIGDATQNLYIGCDGVPPAGGFVFDGGIGWSRISDIVRYTVNFTPPRQCDLPVIDVNTVGQWIGIESSGATIDNQEGTPGRDGTQFNCFFDIDCERCYGNVDLTQVSQPVADHIYVANKCNEANITHIFRYDAAPAGFGGNLVGTAPFDLLPTVPAVGDMAYFGIAIGPDAGPFSSLVFDLENVHSDITSIVWEYWDGGAWDTLVIAKDNTEDWFHVPLGRPGVNSVAWGQPSDWATTAVNTVTGHWVRARVVSVGGAPTPSRQQNRDIYTVVWPYLEVDSGDIGGDIIALALFKQVSAGFEIDDIIVGLRSLARGSGFSAYLNCADEQNPPGISVAVSGGCAFGDTLSTGSGREVLYTAGADGIVEIRFGSSVCNQYYGVYHAYLRGLQDGGYEGDTIFSVKVELGTGQVVQEQLTGFEFKPDTDWFLVDIGRLEMSPPTLLDSNESYDENKIVIDVSGTQNVHFYNVVLVPIDEWAAKFTDLEQGASSTNRLKPGRLLEFESVQHPKQSLRANLWNRRNQRIVGHWDKQANGPAILQANANQRLWVLASLGNVSRPEILTWFSVEGVRRYLSMRGDR